MFKLVLHVRHQTGDRTSCKLACCARFSAAPAAASTPSSAAAPARAVHNVTIVDWPIALVSNLVALSCASARAALPFAAVSAAVAAARFSSEREHC
jgi:hypothetical protein